MDRHGFGRRLAEAARAMSATRNPADTLQRIAAMAVELIDACDVAGVCVLRPGRNDTCAHTHASLQVMDDLQHDLAEGPAMSGPRPPTWSRWVTSARTPGGRGGERGGRPDRARADLGFRLFVEDDSIGMLNLYAYEPDAFDHEDKLDGLVAAAHASVALSATVRHDQMHTALTSRQLIGEATGILRERFALTSDQAFAVLKRLSSQQNIKLFAVAQQVVETGHPAGLGALAAAPASARSRCADCRGVTLPRSRVNCALRRPAGAGLGQGGAMSAGPMHGHDPSRVRRTPGRDRGRGRRCIGCARRGPALHGPAGAPRRASSSMPVTCGWWRPSAHAPLTVGVTWTPAGRGDVPGDCSRPPRPRTGPDLHGRRWRRRLRGGGALRLRLLSLEGSCGARSSRPVPRRRHRGGRGGTCSTSRGGQPDARDPAVAGGPARRPASCGCASRGRRGRCVARSPRTGRPRHVREDERSSR